MFQLMARSLLQLQRMNQPVNRYNQGQFQVMHRIISFQVHHNRQRQ